MIYKGQIDPSQPFHFICSIILREHVSKCVLHSATKVVVFTIDHPGKSYGTNDMYLLIKVSKQFTTPTQGPHAMQMQQLAYAQEQKKKHHQLQLNPIP